MMECMNKERKEIIVHLSSKCFIFYFAYLIDIDIHLLWMKHCCKTACTTNTKAESVFP
jgi:hypothetical protein